MPRNKKPNEPPKKFIKQQERDDKKDKLVKSGRNFDDNRYGLITSKPDYKSDQRNPYSG